MTTRAVFDDHRKWKKLPEPLLNVLAERLNSPEAIRPCAPFIQGQGMPRWKQTQIGYTAAIRGLGPLRMTGRCLS